MKRTILTLTLVLGSSICTQSFGFDLLDRMLGVKGCCSSSSCDTGCCTEPTCGCEAPCEVACEPTCGCEAPCEVACEPTCGCEAPVCGCDTGCPAPKKSCGLFSGSCLSGGCAEPTCGCEAPCEPTCGCEAPCEIACEPTCGCEAPCEPECGCEVATCDSGCNPCGKKSGGLLSKLFNHKCSLCNKSSCDSCCDMACEPECGCEVASCDMGCDSACGSKKSCGLLSKLFGNLCKKKSSCCDSGCDMACGCGAPVAPSCGCGAPSAPIEYSAPVAPQAAPMPPAPIVDPSASVTTKRRVIQASASYVR
ncbi:hypothetical protein Poly41_12050 [Novipirellula artificiosorum]|uniref:Uncharacterized protein n=1 Tax=Novipirellula artificiosorum TaxID=2528016 RepID=A0A5C6E328_9BACT|nr:hypothetical protein Poly41_12050 [Novipirellula artificiosorum]